MDIKRFVYVVSISATGGLCKDKFRDKNEAVLR